MTRERKLLVKDKVDPIWSALREQAEAMTESEPELASFAHATILKHERLEQALSYHLAKKIGNEDLSPMQVREIFEDVLLADRAIGEAVRADLSAVFQRDPACHSYAQAFLFFKGFHALESYRVAHYLWTHRRQTMALFIQNRMSDLFAVDIHPAAKLGRGIMIDHATGVVIGETAVIGDDCHLTQGVTLGGTSNRREKRHPTLETGVVIGALLVGAVFRSLVLALAGGVLARSAQDRAALEMNP